MLPALGSWLAVMELGWVMRRLDTMAQEVVVTIISTCIQWTVTSLTLLQVSTLDPVASTTRGAAWDATTLHSWLAANTRCSAVREVGTAAFRWTGSS